MFLARALLKVRAKNKSTVALIPNKVQRESRATAGTEQHQGAADGRQHVGCSGRFFLKTITQPGTLSVQVAHTQTDAKILFEIVHRFYRNLPQELRRGVLRTSRANACQLVFPALDSEYRVVSAGDANAGRGMTIQNLHCSEVSRWPGNAAETMAGLRAAMPPGGGTGAGIDSERSLGVFLQRVEERGRVWNGKAFLPLVVRRLMSL